VSAKETHSTTSAVLDATPTGVESGAEGRAFARPELLGPIIAVLVLLSFATLSFRHAIVGAAFAGVLVVLAAIDLERGIIPNRIVLPAAGALYVLQLALFPSHVLAWTLAPLTASLLLALPHLFGRSWMGMGDVKLALLIGVALGWQVFTALLVAFLCLFPVALFMIAHEGLKARKKTIPFGPFMALGALIVLFLS
jgi:leader peptidase (prepilin peptidase)/N-methyltransferase